MFHGCRPSGAESCWQVFDPCLPVLLDGSGGLELSLSVKSLCSNQVVSGVGGGRFSWLATSCLVGHLDLSSVELAYSRRGFVLTSTLQFLLAGCGFRGQSALDWLTNFRPGGAEGPGLVSHTDTIAKTAPCMGNHS